MALSLEEMFSVHGRESRNKVYGVVPGIVTNNKDDDGHYRVKVRFPWLPNGGAENPEESWWCRIASPMAGKGRGFFNLPEVGDEVLVAFEHGDINRPYVIGMLWNTDDTAIVDNKSQDGKNNMRTFKSRSGHVLEFCDDAENKKEKITLKSAKGGYLVIDDTDSAHKIEIQDKDGKNKISIDNQNKKITIQTDSGDLHLEAKENLTIKAKAISITSDNDTEFSAKGFKIGAKTFEAKASGTGNIEMSGSLTIKGSTVNIN